MDLDLVKLNHLLTISRIRSFSRAAEELRITQPALSRSVALVERRFGFRIFERGRSGVSLTPVGARVIADAEELIRSARVLEHNLRLYRTGEAGGVDFGMGPLVASLLLSKLGAHMLAARPQLQMRCSIKYAEVLQRDLLNDTIEMMFCGADAVARSPEVVIEPVGSVTLTMIVRSQHPLTGKRAPMIADVSAYPFLSARELQSRNLPERNGALICDNYDILRGAVLRSDSVWLSCPEMVADDLANGRLAEINVLDMPPRRIELAVVRLRGRSSSPAAKEITRYVRMLLSQIKRNSSSKRRRRGARNQD